MRAWLCLGSGTQFATLADLSLSLIHSEGNGVMMGWETGIMNKTATLLCEDHPNAAHLRVLNVGHGLGIVDELLQQHGQQPAKHVIVEAHPDVLKHMREKGWYDRPGVEIFEGQWQDWLKTNQETFDVVYWDTFSEHYRWVHFSPLLKSMYKLITGSGLFF